MNENDNFPIGGCLAILIIAAFLVTLGYLIAVCTLIDGKPTAMDVYRGKTTLEYTIRDGVKTDSVVIFKK